MKKQVAMIVILMITGVTNGLAQTWNLPANRKDTLYFTDYFNIPRPALSMRGFDNLKNDAFHNQYSNTTYGVKQVLERTYGVDGYSQVNSVKDVFNAIITQYQKNDTTFEPFTTNGNKEFNSSMLESRAFSSRSQSRFGNAQREAPLPQQSRTGYSKFFPIKG